MLIEAKTYQASFRAKVFVYPLQVRRWWSEMQVYGSVLQYE